MFLDRILPARSDRTAPRADTDRAPATPAPDDDFWYGPAIAPAASGVSVTPEGALAIAAVWRAVTMLARDVGTLGCHVYRRLPSGGKARATGHPLYAVLRHRPNEWQTAPEYWEMAVGHMALRGNHYARIVPGPRGFCDQLVPLAPQRMRVVQLLPSRRVVYLYTPEGGGPEEPIARDEVFHLRWFTIDGLVGIGPISYARESLGLTMAAEGYGARFFAQNSRPAGALKTAQGLTDEQYLRVRKQWEAVHGGLAGAHKTAILEKGLEWQQIGLSNEDAQFLATREFQNREIANWFGIPEHKLAMAETPTFASIEAYDTSYYNDGVRPICVKAEAAIFRDLILAEATYFAEFLMEGRLRGDTQARSAFYHGAVLDGWMTRNEVRERENLNPLPGLDDPLEPRNMAPAGSQGTPGGTGAGQAAAASAAKALAQTAADRIVRKELAAVRKAAERHARSSDSFVWAIRKFYDAHAAFVAEVMQIDLDAARAYCEAQRDVLMTEGLAAADAWAATLPNELALLALRRHTDAPLATADDVDAPGTPGAPGAHADGAVGAGGA